ncbi:MAG: PDZ domain-containing protein, partial [Nitrospirota bacterium]|nr:PDZ domain-containing protein [Nitrospirota bacterium]
VDLKGQVIGINVAIFSTTGGYQGIGFAIPINTAKRIISRLIEGKKIVYGWLGITVQDLNDNLIQHFGLPDKNGVLVAKVLEDNPAKKAGMEEGDIIKFIDSVTINNVRELLSVVGKFEAGRHVKVSVLRDKRPLILDLVIGERPQAAEVEEQGIGLETGKWRGLAIENLSPEITKRFQIEEKSGVVVVDVEPNSDASDAGLIPGDVILEINKKSINNTLDYEKAVKGLKGNCLVRTSRGFFIVKESSEKK